jgi:hypothetical protein
MGAHLPADDCHGDNKLLATRDIVWALGLIWPIVVAFLNAAFRDNASI